MRRRADLSRPREDRRSLGVHYDPEAFGRFSETIARTFGTARFLVIQTVIVALWILVNITWIALQWDPYPFILLNLAFSTQAAYAAPLILLAQNRQEVRDRHQTEIDRDVAARTQADTEFLARELAAVRLALGDVVTNEDLREHLETVSRQLDQLRDDLANRPDRSAGPPDRPRGRRVVG
jgi:uncharacterized membrane protein